MRYLVLSDIHANLEALDAVLADSFDAGCERTLVLGDLVGYGADPNAVVERVRGMANTSVIRGNHDKVATGIETSDGFNRFARAAIAWTGHALTPDNHGYVLNLPKGPVPIDDEVEICHGSPFDEDTYIFDELDARRALQTATRRLCLFGHTHVPSFFSLSGDRFDGRVPLEGARVEVPLKGERTIVNCGAVGQPRDGDWRAAYGIADTDAGIVTVVRVEYDVEAAQAKILAAGLPETLALRLRGGR